MTTRKRERHATDEAVRQFGSAVDLYAGSPVAGMLEDAAAEDESSAGLLSWRDEAETVSRRLAQKIQQTTEEEGRYKKLLKDARRARAKLQELCANNQFLRLCVGGVEFDVPIRTLLCEQGSTFHTIVLGHFMLDVDPTTNAILLDRDPTSFRYILNYLRGYRRIVIPEEDQPLVDDDIDYYQIPLMRSVLGTEPVPSNSVMTPGPGVHVDGKRVRVSYSVAPIGNLLVAGRHQITFEVLSGEYLGIGLCSEHCTSSDQEFHKTFNCCVYYMTGVFYSNFPTQRKEESLEKFQTGDIVSLVLDMDERTVEYIIKGVVAKVVSCTSAVRLRFAVVGKLCSGVRIVSNEYFPPPLGGELGGLEVVMGGNANTPQGQQENSTLSASPIPLLDGHSPLSSTVPPPPPPPPRNRSVSRPEHPPSLGAERSSARHR